MAMVDYFLKIEGVDGESTDDKHKNEIDILSFSWGETQSGAGHGMGAGAGAGKVSMQDFHFVAKTSKASPKLFLACAMGEHYKKATLVARRAGKGQQEYMKFVLEECLVTSYQIGGSQGDVVPSDQFSLNFAKIQYEYKPQNPDGTVGGPVVTGYNVSKNVKV